MRSINMYIPAVATVATVALGVSSAPAANWDPANTNFAGVGPSFTLTDNAASPGTVTCKLTVTFRSTGNTLAVSPAPPVFDGCSSNIANLTTVHSSVNWTATATSTTSVDLTGSLVATIAGVCTITASWAVPNNTWSNTTHQLTLNSATAFPITEHGFCDGATSGKLSGVITFPSNTIIT
jgi:hypothetical protein